MKKLSALLSVTCLCALAVCAQTKQYALKIGEFTEFTVSDNINVNYKSSADSAGYAVYECAPEHASVLTFTNNKGKIKIEAISETNVSPKLPTVTIYSAVLTKATNLGDSTVCILRANPSEKLSLKVMGNGFLKAFDLYNTKLSAAVEAGSGHIFITGTVQEAKFTIAGAGIIEAGGLKASKVKAWMFGTGSIDCMPENELGVYGAGSGSIYYMGSPKIKKRDVGVKVVNIGE